ncbi:copper resistance protein CopC [Planococcus sp. X10-3]|uniref:copper resistance CopC family protein n=1 Tax=Planococcus sp. X10-3 TaxID=3061240 RepID=UPI003BAE214A
MKKLLVMAFLLMLIPITAHAHAGLSSSTPAEGESLEASPTEISFQFDTPIQQGDMTISEETGNAFTFSDISNTELELIGQLDAELPNGAYIVDWSAISQDGHEITGTLTFNVAAEMTEEEANDEAEEEQAAADANEEEVAPPADEQAEEDVAADVEPAQARTPWVTILIIALLIVAAATFFVMARRK